MDKSLCPGGDHTAIFHAGSPTDGRRLRTHHPHGETDAEGDGALGPDWTLRLPLIAHAYNSSPQGATDQIPCLVAFNRKPSHLFPENTVVTGLLPQETQTLYTTVKHAIEDARARAALYHDKGRKPTPDLQPGDKVMVKTVALGRSVDYHSEKERKPAAAVHRPLRGDTPAAQQHSGGCRTIPN